MSYHIRRAEWPKVTVWTKTTAWIRSALWLGGLAALGGCSLLTPVQIDTARTGETVVRILGPQTFDELAESVYGDASLGPRIAELAHLAYADGLQRGEVLVLPVRQQFDERLRRARQADERFAAGLSAADRGSYRSAAESFRSALDVAPHRLDVRYNYGLALLQSDEPVAATPILEEVARLRPRHAGSRYAFGSALRKRRAWDRAIAEFEAALDLDRDHAAASYALARTWEDRGEEERALNGYRRFLGRFPEDALAPSARERLRRLEERPEPIETPTADDPTPAPLPTPPR